MKKNILVLGLICSFMLTSFCINNFVSDVCNPQGVKQDTITKTLLLFYTSYIAESLEMNYQKISELKQVYITSKFLKKLQKLDLDYDPFVDAQDFDESWLESLKVVRSKEINGVYEVYWFDNYDQKYVCIKLRVIKEDCQYKINSILSLE